MRKSFKSLSSRNSNLGAKYKISHDDYEELLKKQDNKCVTCLTDVPIKAGGVLDIDHCHTSGKVRGLLCHNCNIAIGLARDDSDILRNMASYLESKASNRRFTLGGKNIKFAGLAYLAAWYRIPESDIEALLERERQLYNNGLSGISLI